MSFIDDIVSINITRQNVAIALENLDIILILGETGSQENVVTYKEYGSLIEVADDFNNNTTEYSVASSIFMQEIKPKKIIICTKDANGNYLEAFNYMINNYNKFYGVICLSANQEEWLGVAGLVEAEKKLIAICTVQETALDTLENDTTSIAKALYNLHYKRSICIYSFIENITQHPDSAWLGLQLTKPAGSSNWAYQELAGITPNNLTTAQRNNLEAKNCNFYIAVANRAVTYAGKVSSGEWIDVIRNLDWIENNLKISVFNLLLTSEKIPLTDEGITTVEHVVRNTLNVASEMGMLIKDSIKTNFTKRSDMSQEDINQRRIKGTFTAELQGSVNTLVIQGSITG